MKLAKNPLVQFAQETKQAIRRLRRDGWSYAKLGGLIGVDPRTVQRWCNAESKNKADIKKREWYRDTKPTRRAVAKKYYDENRDTEILRVKEYKEINKKQIQAYGKRYRHLCPEVCRANEAARRGRKIKATPPWLNQEHKMIIRGLYAKAKELEKQTGIKHHVDHVYPLKHKLCCGLHVPWNLEVVPAADNLRKYNKLPTGCRHSS